MRMLESGDQGAVGADIGDRAIRRERQVPLVGATVRRRCNMHRLREPFLGVADIGDHGVGGLLRAHAVEQFGIARKRRTVLPRHLELLGGLHGIPLVLGDDADEVALVHDAGARNVLDRALVDAGSQRAGAKRALTARQHDAAVQHAGHAHMLHVHVVSGHLVRHVAARVDLRLNGLSPSRSPYLTERKPFSPSTDTTPFDTVRLPVCTPSRTAARANSAWRASAAAARSAGAPRWIDELELVAPWFGVTLVSMRTALTWLISRSSSSAAICNRPVVLPCPISILPK